MYVGVLSDMGGQDFHNWPVISFRIAGDSLQGINSTETELHFWVPFIVGGAKLFDCFVKTVGDLTLFGSSDVSPGEVQASQYGKPTNYLGQGRARVIFGLEH